MANPLFKALGGNNQNLRNSSNNLAQSLIQSIQNFKGDPCQILQSKLDSGEMTQAQYNQMRNVAENIVQRMISIAPPR